jgi:3-hydroxy-9,10-secoandrosta-1,3,5(10)-triene-9,17-dione monooxygenase reductase component
MSNRLAAIHSSAIPNGRGVSDEFAEPASEVATEFTIEPRKFREVLSSYPTGVCVVAAQSADGRKHAMAIGSFSSISLDPPLVGFYPTKTSSSWRGIAEVGRFCVSVLGDDQLEYCKRFATKSPDKFDGLSHRSSPGGQPVLDDVLAWIDCVTEAVHEVGDHMLVVGRVEQLEKERDGLPLLFFGGAYHRIEQLDLDSPRISLS